jgi:hypothetical protein
MASIDITGQRFGRLVVLRLAPRARRERYWVCRCDCGNETTIRGDHLRYGRQISCGCYKREESASRMTVHGGEGSRLYNTWQKMRGRCADERNARYGGRGIRVCDEWSAFPTFRDWALASGYSEELTIDRIDNDGDYCPVNCRWATPETQARNRGGYNTMLTFNGKTACLTEHAKDADLPGKLVWERIKRRGWSVERALTTRKRTWHDEVIKLWPK